MESGALENSELISLAKKETRRFIKAMQTKDIAMGNRAIKSMRTLLDASINTIEFDGLWHTGPIEYAHRKFCFTGKFTTGTREECQQLVRDRGGIVGNSPTLDLDYLIVGGEKNPDWIHENYGRKIERALEIRDQKAGESPLIVAESDWAKTL